MNVGGAKITYNVQLDGFNAKLRRAAEIMGRMNEDLVKEAAKFFVQSATKDTPQTKYKKRELLPMRNRHQRRPAFFLVKWRRPDSSGRDRRGTWTFGSQERSKANAHLPITHRGVGKAAWLFSAERIGIQVKSSFKPSSPVRSQYSSVADASMSKGYFSAIANLTNKARGISRYGERAAAWAIGKAGNRVLGWARAEKRKRLSQLT